AQPSAATSPIPASLTPLHAGFSANERLRCDHHCGQFGSSHANSARLRPVAIISEATDGTVGFAATERGVITGVTAGKLNRITGLTSIDFKTNDGTQIFDGTCKRAEKLF